uniref:Uncharacterized protein n=1 Tax=viral metagenome TaxID=1070528 RepID=A0A6C0BF17_9ZZZZ
MEEFMGFKEEEVLPESLAWRLLTDDDFVETSIGSSMEDTEEYFQVLITIYMEMIFFVLKSNYVNDGNTDYDSFKPDLTELTINSISTFFYEKLLKIGVILSVEEIHDTDINDINDFGKSSNDYYCKIMLKDTMYGEKYFENNTKRYTFLRKNKNNIKNDKLNDFYAVCALPHIKIKVSFFIL